MQRSVVRLRRRGYQLAALLLVCVLAPAVPAGAQAAGGVITGTITDAQGLVLPGVTLTLRDTQTGVTRTGVSEADGRYRLPGLPPGTYILTAELQGFAPAEVKDLTITIDLELRRDFSMALQGLQESVTVSGQAPVVETTKTAVASVVTQQQIESLPIPSRQPGYLALLLPGTSLDATSVRRSQPNIGAGGSGNTMNVYYIDGGSNYIYNSGQQFVEAPQAAIQEFKVNISQSTAEYGAVGGVMLTATKNGTNRFSGEAFEYFRDKSLNAMNKFEQQAHDTRGTPKPDFRRNQYGVGIGGPIVRDRVHFFFAFERAPEERTAIVNTGQPQFYSALEGVFPASYTRRQLFMRGDLQINPKQTAFIRYINDREDVHCETCGGSRAAFFGSDVLSPRDTNVIGHTWVISSRMLNEFRAQVAPSHMDNRNVPPGTAYWPQSRQGEFPPERFEGYTQIYVFPSLSWGANSWSLNWTDRWEINDGFTITAGNHSVKFGGAYLDFNSVEEQSNNKGQWTYSTDQFFDGTPASMANLRNPIQFTATFPPTMRYLVNHWIQAYVQDDWRLTSNFTLNLGLRYDNQYKGFNNNLNLSLAPRLAEIVGDPKTRADNNNVGPRVGFAWDLTGDGRSVVRGAYGLTYQYLIAGGTVRAEQTTLRQTSIIIRNPPYPDPYGGRDPIEFASTAPPNVTILDHDIRNATSQTVTLGISRELRPNLALHVDGDYSNVDGVAMTANTNTPDPVTGLRSRPTWGSISTLQARGEHKYRALMVRLDKRFADNYQYLVSYTLAKQDNYGGGATPAVTDFYNPGLDWGPGSADRRHALVASGSVLLPFDVTLGAVWTYRSSMPFSARAGVDLNNDRAVTDYVPGTTRNMGNRDNDAMLAAVNAWRAQNGRAPISADQIDTNEYNRLDLRVGKSVPLGANRRIEFFAQVFNVFGSDNLLGIDSTWTENSLSASFGRILTVQNRQQGELAVRVVF